ncbi:hypothetical protein RA19_23190 [Leisingera sp. ANG-M1]|uniref:GntR family transcriptional regulator n=1 Tax=Leisingera sp. ANG-M1 TaxID=1577895 RepID=UPI00057D8FD6|nr:hypothetical protein RA19_23190 [Leisingera sp. ANG-M1]
MTHAERAYEGIETLVIVGDLAPGSLHTEREFCELLQIGRTPIREALQRLSHEGLVEFQQRRGIRIPALHVEDQLKLLQVRRVVEVMWVEDACEHATSGQRFALCKQADVLQGSVLRSKTRIEFFRNLGNAQNLLNAAAGNPFLMSSMRPIQGLSNRFWFHHAHCKDYEPYARLHSVILRTVSAGCKIAATSAADALVDYLLALAINAQQSLPANRID